MKEPDIYTYVLVRTDMPRIHQAVQCGHAVQEAAKRFGKTPKVNHLIYLQVPDKKGLLEALERLEMNDVQVQTFCEPDYDRGLTAIATDYITSREKRDLLCNYEMLWAEDVEDVRAAS